MGPSWLDRCSRRSVLSLLAVPTAVGSAVLRSRPAGAGRAWCRTHPVVKIEDALADIVAAAPFDAPLRVTGPNEFVVTVPRGADADLIINDLGFGKGSTVRIARSRRLRRTSKGTQVQIKLRVPAKDDRMPVRLEVAPRLIDLIDPVVAEGTANEWIGLRTIV